MKPANGREKTFYSSIAVSLLSYYVSTKNSSISQRLFQQPSRCEYEDANNSNDNLRSYDGTLH